MSIKKEKIRIYILLSYKRDCQMLYTLWGVTMGAIVSKLVMGNSIPFDLSSWYTWTTPWSSGCCWKASDQLWIRVRTFSCKSAGGSFFGPLYQKHTKVNLKSKKQQTFPCHIPINLTISWMKSLVQTSTWNRRPQFFTHVSKTYASRKRNCLSANHLNKNAWLMTHSECVHDDCVVFSSIELKALFDCPGSIFWAILQLVDEVAYFHVERPILAG